MSYGIQFETVSTCILNTFSISNEVYLKKHKDYLKKYKDYTSEV